MRKPELGKKGKPEEYDAYTGWRRFLYWKPGERKAIKERTHRRDRRAVRQNLKEQQ